MDLSLWLPGTITSVAITVTVIAGMLSYTWKAVKSKRKGTTLPPGPRGLPLVGYLPFLKREIHQQFKDEAQIYGPVMKVNVGSKLWIILSSPEVAKEALQEKDINFSTHDSPTVAATLFDGAGITWSPYGDHWRKLRKVFVREVMSNVSLDYYYVYRRREIRAMVQDVFKRNGTHINICELTFIVALNTVCGILWGGNMSGEKRKEAVEMHHLLDEIQLLMGKLNISDIFPSLARFDLQGVARDTKKLEAKVDAFMNDVIEQNKDAGGKSRHLLLLLLQLMKQGQMTLPDVKALFMDILFGGTDTTSTTLEWAMAEILYHPEVMKKIQLELDKVVGPNNIVEESHMPSLPYLDAVLKESQRMHPLVPLLAPYKTSESCIVGEYLIPKDSTLFVNVWAIQRDPKYWEDPLKFRPERFLEGSKKWDFRGTDYRYLPFGTGRRVCAGIPMAERLLKMVIASLLHSFNWCLPEDAKPDVSEWFQLVLKKEEPLLAVPTPRLSNPELYI